MTGRHRTPVKASGRGPPKDTEGSHRGEVPAVWAEGGGS